MLNVGSWYSIANAKLKPANPKYNENDGKYSIVLTEYSQIIKLQPNNEKQKENKFVKIKETTEKNLKYMDVIGIVLNVGTLTSIYSWKCNTSFNKRKLTICDETGIIDVTLWDHQASLYNEKNINMGDILDFKNVTLTEYNGYGLSSPCQILINEQNAKAEKLRQWYEKTQHRLHHIPQLSSNIPIPTPALKNINEIKSKYKKYKQQKANNITNNKKKINTKQQTKNRENKKQKNKKQNKK